MSDIRDSLREGSLFFEKARKMRDPQAKPKVYVYVEDIADKLFWSQYFKQYEDQYSFEKYVYHTESKIEPGKSAILSAIVEKKIGLGNRRICCLDADYDFWNIGDKNVYLQEIQTNPYIVNTWGYAIENIKCHSDNLKDVCEKVAIPSCMECNFKESIENFSVLYAPLIKLSILSTRRNDKYYTLKKFNQDIATTLDFDLNGNILDSTKLKVSAIVMAHEAYFAEVEADLTVLNNQMVAMGIEDSDLYSFMQGHIVEERVACVLVNQVALAYRNSVLARYRVESSPQKENLINEYLNLTGTKDKSTNERILELLREEDHVVISPFKEHINPQIERALCV